MFILRVVRSLTKIALTHLLILPILNTMKRERNQPASVFASLSLSLTRSLKLMQGRKTGQQVFFYNILLFLVKLSCMCACVLKKDSFSVKDLLLQTRACMCKWDVVEGGGNVTESPWKRLFSDARNALTHLYV